LDLGVLFLGKLELISGITLKRAQKLTTAIFDEIVATSHGIGAQAVFVYLPVMQEMLDPDSKRGPNEQYLFSYCEDRQIPCLFLRPRFAAAAKKGVVFNIRKHWEPSTHRLAAQAIGAFLLDRGLISGSDQKTVSKRELPNR
jgi:hypothetical protein